MNKKIFLLTLMCLALASSLKAQVNVTSTGGTSNASYSTLETAFAQINLGTHTGTITIGISANTSETASAVLNASGNGSASYSTITISPTGGAGRTISGAITAGSPLIDLNGADNVTFDGINSGGNSLTISNTTASTTSGTSTIRFINGATSNTITNCTIQGSFSGTLATNGGNIFFSTDGTTSNGNDNNTISYCDITAAGSNLPSKCIFMNGSTTTAAIGNSGNVIQYNNIYDYFLTSGCAGVYALTGNSDLTVKNNKLYQTGTRTFTASGTMHGIYFANSTYGNNIYISDNIIGYASSSGTGTLTLTGSTFAGAFTGITVGIMSTSSQAYINRNTVSDISLTSSSGALTGIFSSTATASSNSVYVDTNTVANITTSTSTGILYGINWSTVSNLYARGNTINNITRNTAGTTYGMYSGSSPVNEYLNYNTISNISNTASSASTVTMRGIYILTASGIKECNYNTVYGLSIPNSTATANVLEGIRWNYGVTVSITGNNIYNLTGVANTLIGFATAGTTTSATYTISKNKIYGLQSTYASATAGFCSGITISGGTSNTYNVSNNLLGNITATTASNVDAIRGINLTTTGTTSAINLYYNTVYLNASSTGTNFGTSGVYHAASTTATTAALTMHNNIIYNNSTAAGTGLVVAFRRSSGAASTLANYASASNNNLLYAGSPSATNVIYYDGTSTGQTIADYKGGAFTAGTIASRDAASVTESMTFQSTTGSSSNFLKFDLTIPTQVESGGAVISGYTDDYTGTSRSGSTPDIGAWELSGTAADLSGPSISYTNITNTNSTSNRTLTSFATITDASGVDTATNTRPRIYYKKSSDNNTFGANTSGTNGWKWVEASNTASPFSFTIDISIINGGSITQGDTIQYFVVAQDKATTPNVGANPSGGFSGTSVGSISSAPTTPGYYIITAAPLSGSYDVGASGAYATITTAVTDVVLRGVSGAVTFNLIDAAYNSGETFPIVIGNVAGASATNTVTIKPASSMTVTISGSHAISLFTFNGSSYVSIDGSNNGSSTKDLTIQNTITSATSSVILVAGGATYSTIKNCNLTNGSVAVINYGISIGGSTPGTGGADVDNITIQNNNITAATVGIFAMGTTAVSAGGLDNLSITGNSISYTATVTGCFGIRAGYALNSAINQNTISIETSAASLAGITAETGFVSSTINGNLISKVKTTNAASIPVVRGIIVGTGQTGSAVTIANNVIYNVISAYATTNVGSNCAGIMLGAVGIGTTYSINTGGVNLYYNSINLYGTVDRNSATTEYGIFLGTTVSSLDIRNNSIANSIVNGNASGTASKSYAIYSQAANTAFSTINYNDFYVSGTQGVLAYLGSDATTLSALQTAFGQNSASVNSNPLYNSSTNLVPQPGNPLAGAGTALSGYTTDYTGATRSGSTPTIGAYENSADAVAPVITYTAFTNTSSTSNRTLSVTITDATGVPTTGSLQPRIYFRKGAAGTWYSAQGSLSSGSGSNGTWSFTITSSTMGGVSTSDTVYYYVIAQDSSSSNNITSNPSTGLSASNVNTVSSAPTSPNTYIILSPLGTSLTVCSSGCSYTTLTASGGLFDAINSNVLGGNTSVTINGDLTAETGAIALTNAGMGGYTLTINPNAASVKIIAPSSDLSTALIRLNGAAGVTIDGRFSGSGQYLRIVNTHATAASCQPAFQVLGGATGNTIRNCILETNTSSTTQATVAMGTGTNTLTIQYNNIRDAVGTPGTAGSNSNGIYSNTSTNTATIQNNEIFNYTGTGVLLTSVGDGCDVSNNSFYNNSSTPPSTAQTGITISAGSGHTVSGNYIGGQSANCGGSAWANSGAITFSGISLGVGTTTTTSVQGNTIQNINLTGTAGVNFNGILISSGSINAGTTTPNIIGSSSTSNSIQNSGSSSTSVTVGINHTGAGTVSISNNTIANLTATGTTTSVGLRGISHTGTGTPTIYGNSIYALTSSATTTSVTTAACLGIYSSSSNTSQVIEANTIYNLSNTASSAGNYTSGITITNSTSNGTIKRNRIYDLKNSSSAGFIVGIYFNFGNWTAANNQISLSNGSNTNAATIRGIHDNSGNAVNYYYNTIYIGGSITSGAVNSYAFYRGTSTTTVTLRNNIFYNIRSGGTGSHYAIGNLGSTVATGWGATASNYNLFVVADTTKMGEWASSTDRTLAQWQTSSSGDASSMVELTTNLSAANLFSAVSSGNLNIISSNVECWYLNGRGTQVTGQTEDYGSSSAGRSITLSGGGTDIGSDEFTPGVNPPNVTVSGTIGLGNTQTFTFAGKTVATVTWQSGTLPTSWTTYKYWPGSWPNNTTSGGSVTGAKYSNAYWVLTPDVTTGFTYDVVLYYDDALLGTIAAETDAKLAKMSSGQNWISYASTINTTANTVSMAGLNSFSEFTLNDVNNPLPVEWLSFTGKKVFDNVDLSWTTATETNNSHFEIERSADGRNFEQVGEVSGAGNSHTPRNYNYTDVAPFGSNSILYYRLKQVDFNGAFDYSKVIAVSNNKQGNGVTIEAITPNPFTEKLKLTLNNVSEGNVTIEVYDLSGRKHYTQTTLSNGQGTLTIDLSSLSNLAKGVYIVNIRNGNEARQQKLVKLK